MTIARAALAAVPALLAACTTLTPPKVPTALNPPADQMLYLETLAEGVQIYECTQKTDGNFEWTFKAPEASLRSRSSEVLGTHYEGPTWRSIDGSTVVAEVKARDAGPTPTAIPWLLLSAKANTGANGSVFSATKSIQRVDTVGGLAPATPCTSGALKMIARVPYTATYYFYR